MKRDYGFQVEKQKGKKSKYKERIRAKMRTNMITERKFYN